MATTGTNHWKLGLFVVLSITAIVVTMFWLGAHSFKRDSFKTISYFDESVEGLEIGSPVKWRGVTVGTVADLTVAPDGRQVQVASDVYVDALTRLGLKPPQPGGAFIDPDLRVQLASAGITGVRFLSIDFFDPERYPPPPLSFAPPWNYVPSTPSTLKSLEESVLDILGRFPELEVDAKGALVDLRKTLDSVDRLSDWLGGEDSSFNQLLVQLRSASARVERALDEAQLGATTHSLRDASTQVKTSASDVADLREELAASLVALRETLESVRTLVDSLERDPSALIRGPRSDGPVPRKSP
jgi:paraquat-inducible protein B